MTLEEKIGQKIMLDFRYWDPVGSEKQDMTGPDGVIGQLISNNHIGGVILFPIILRSGLRSRSLQLGMQGWRTAEACVC